MKVAEIAPLLRARGITHAQLAERLGVSRVHISQMLSRKRRMSVDTLQAIEAFLAEAERKSAPGVAETKIAFEHPRVRFATLEEARKIGPAPPLSTEESARWRRALRELGEAGKRLPRVTEMSDDEILGYDEMK